MQEFAWQGFALQLPEDWECVRFGKDPKRGECALADRHGPRLILSWHAVSAKADVGKIREALIQEVRRKDPGGNVESEKEWLGPEPWRGFLWKGREHLAVAVAHFPQANYLVQVQFVRHSRKNVALEPEILRSLAFQPADRPWRWRAFGCRLTLGREYRLQECAVIPGRLAMVFRAPGQERQFRIERLALPERCLEGRSLADWYRSRAAKNLRIVQTRPVEFRGHAAAALDLNLRPESTLYRLLWRRNTGEGRVWVCEKEQRLYCAEWTARKADGLKLEQTVECA